MCLESIDPWGGPSPGGVRGDESRISGEKAVFQMLGSPGMAGRGVYDWEDEIEPNPLE